MTNITEGHIQAVIMRHVMSVMHHEIVIPNSNQFYPWEADLLSITKAQLIHEFEVKISKHDYKRDAEKRKHYLMRDGRGPSYFWYVTYGFEIEPPENAGWMLVHRNVKEYEDYDFISWKVEVKKDAPRLRNYKMGTDNIHQISRLLSWRIHNMFVEKYLKDTVKK